MNGGLSRFRFLFTMHVGYKGNVYQGKVIVPDTKLELPHGFYEWCRLYITDCPSKLQKY
jgi:hypothetical protein